MPAKKAQSANGKKTGPTANRNSRPAAAGTNSSRSKTSVGESGEPKSKPAVVTARPNLSSEDIGHVAGLVWGYLAEDREPQTLAAIKKSVDAPGDVVLAAIGWLAREGKLALSTTGRTVKLALRQ